jgi:separase
MSASYHTLVVTLRHGAQHVLHTVAEVDNVAASAEQLAALHYRRLSSSWDIPKLLCAVLRVQLNARLANADGATTLPLMCLVHLLLVCWRLCPLASLPPPAALSLPTCSPSTRLPPTRTAGSAAAWLLSISQRDVERIAVELDSVRELDVANVAVSSSASPTLKVIGDAHRTALATLLALLSYWHAIAAEGVTQCVKEREHHHHHHGGDIDDEGFQRVSETVWHCVHRWTTSEDSVSAKQMSLATWMGTVLRSALRSDTPSALLRTVEWLERFLSSFPSSALARDTVQSSCANAVLDGCWAQLHVRAFQHVCANLHKYQVLLKTRWSKSVTPVLTRAFAREPSLLSAASLQAVDVGSALEETLGMLVDEVKHLQCSDDAEDVVSVCRTSAVLDPLLQLAALQQHVAVTGLRITPFITATTYTSYLRPVVAVCLQWGLLDVARALLDWAAEGLDKHGKEWRRRLRGLNSADTTVTMAKTPAMVLPAKTDVQPRIGTENCFGGCLYPQWLEQQLSSGERWTSSHALDTLVQCSSVYQLRLVCDALLRIPAPWSATVLTDPFAAYFILRSLATIAVHYLDVGDPPLARFYVALLGQLLPRYLCPTFLSLLLSLLQRFACTLSLYHLSPLNYSLPSSAHGDAVLRWQQMKAFLDDADLPAPLEVVRCPSRDGFPPACVTGMATADRQDFQRYCTTTASPQLLRCTDTRAPSAEMGLSGCIGLRGTVVEMHYTPDAGGTLRLRCSHLPIHGKSPSPTGHVECGFTSYYTASCSAVGASLRACAADMTDVLRCNREQLLRGTLGVEVAGERALLADSQGGVQSASLLSNVAVTSDRPTVSSPAELPTVGEAAPEIHHEQRQLKIEWWRDRYTLDARINEVVVSLQRALGPIRALLAGQPSDALVTRLSILAMDFASQCVQLRGGGPCPPLSELHEATALVLWGGPFLWSSADDGSPAQPTCTYGPSQRQTCAACAATLRTAQTSLLSAIVAVGQSAASHVDDGNGDAWLSLLVDSSVAPLIEALACGALDAYYLECALHTAGTGEVSSHQHLDLQLHPREHTYLILGGELHALPWEGLDVCRDRSVSRVPSCAYLQHACECLRGSAVSLRRALLYRDCDALQSHSGLTEIVERQHPAWEVVYGETLCSAAAAQKHSGPSPPTASALLRRIAGSATDADHLDTYVYAGHRGGEQLIPRAALYEWFPPLSPQSSLVLLMGCSAARMPGNARLDNFGLPHAYISAGVSCVVGCLWDVTDGDVDRLTCRLLDFATSTTQRVTTVGEAVAVARRACKLRCLTGLATVFYGLNLPLGNGEDRRGQSTAG